MSDHIFSSSLGKILPPFSDPGNLFPGTLLFYFPALLSLSPPLLNYRLSLPNVFFFPLDKLGFLFQEV